MFYPVYIFLLVLFIYSSINIETLIILNYVWQAIPISSALLTKNERRCISKEYLGTFKLLVERCDRGKESFSYTDK